MKAISLLLMTTALQAAEPRFQFRSFIQIDGTLMHVKLDTTTGQSWRLERTLTNRRDTTLAGKATERKLAEAMHAKVDNMSGFTLMEALVTIRSMNKLVTGNDGVAFGFRNPAVGRDGNPNRPQHQIVPPVRPVGEQPRGIDPNTGLPFRGQGAPQFPGAGVPRPNPGGGIPPVDPITGMPVRIPGQGGLPLGGSIPGSPGRALDPVTGLPVGGAGRPGGLPGLPIPRGLPGQPLGPMDANIVMIRNWNKPMRKLSTLDLITEILNTLDKPVRCVIDENIVYFVPENATLITRDGKTNKPKFEERWLEIKVEQKN